jgi:hypothetical protein
LEQLLGPHGSTHVYNGTVGTVDGASGKLYVQNFFSRKAPLDENGMISHLFIGANFRKYCIRYLTDLFLLIAITKGNLVQYTGVPQKDLPFPIWLVLFVLVMRQQCQLTVVAIPITTEH